MRPQHRLTLTVGLRWLAAATTGGMLLVLVMGAAVTNTGSAEGCGRSWPLCNGQFMPEFTVATAIEYSHRAVTGVETLLVVALAVAMLCLYRKESNEATVLAALMLVTLLLQAGLGAGAVIWPQSALMLATHFGVSLIALAATYLSSRFVFEHSGVPRTPVQPVPGALRRLAIATGIYVLGVVYLGAYVRHAGVSLACTDWPLCYGQVVPPLNAATGVVFAHRLAALGAVALLGVLWRQTRLAPGNGASSAAAHAFGLSILQALSGALIVWTLLGLFSTLLHAALMGLLFASLAVVLSVAIRPSKRNGSVSYVLSLSDATARDVQHSGSATHALAAPSPAHSVDGGRSRVPVDDGRGRSVTEPI